MDTWHDVGRTLNLSLSLDKRGIRAKRSHFPGFDPKIGEPRLPPKIYGVPLVGFRQAKNESSLHRRGVRMGT